jgi:L-histidine N-alpha-methyltransferase
MNYLHEEKTFSENIDIENHLPKIGIENVIDEIVAGLKASPKYISPKYFYDEKGSELFEKISVLDEYYPTRTEKEILKSIVPKLNIDLNNLNIVELGSGDASKISLIFEQIPEEVLDTINYYPVDISQTAIEKSIEQLNQHFKLNSIVGIVADFISQIKNIQRDGHRLFCFLGSTIGNVNEKETEEFLSMLGNEIQTGDSLLLGLDLLKDINILENAYNDSKNITAAFNKNILNVLNNLIGSDFDTSDFDHNAFFNENHNRIEMHLIARRDTKVNIGAAGERIEIRKGETIHTENSYKFSEDQIQSFGDIAGLDLENVFTDKNNWFGLAYYKKSNHS